MRIVAFAIAGLIATSDAGVAFDPGKASRSPSYDLDQRNAGSPTLGGEENRDNLTGLCAKLPELGVCRSFGDRARDSMSVMDAPGVVCNGQHDDAAGIQRALNLAIFLQGTVRLPQGRTCRISVQLNLGRAHLEGGGTGSALMPLVPMDNMVRVTSTLSSVRRVSFVNQGAKAKSAITVSTPNDDALQTYIEHNYFSNFTGWAIVQTSGHHTVVRGNGFISNYGMVRVAAWGINALIEDNYSAGGRGIIFDALAGQKAIEGGVVQKNIIFAQGDPGWYAFRVNGAIDIHITDNTFEADCNSVIYDGATHGVSYIHSANNWIGSRAPSSGTPDQTCAALTLANQVYGFVSTNDVFAGRGLNGVRTTATAANRANNNATFIAPVFANGPDAGAVDMNLSHMLGITIQAPQFSAAKSIVEGGNVVGRVDGGTFSSVPVRQGGLKYGRQTFGLDTVTEGSAQIAANLNAVDVPFSLPYQPGQHDIQVSFVQMPTNNVGSCAVIGVTSAKFTYQCFNPPGGSGLIFTWKIDIGR